MFHALILAMFIIASNLPQPDPKFDQPEPSFEPRVIETSPPAAITLKEAIDLVAKETGNDISLFNVEKHKDVVDRKESVELAGKNFWEAMALICSTWGMVQNPISDRMGLNFASDLNDGTPFDGSGKSTMYWDPLDGPQLFGPAARNGAYRIAFENAESEILVSVYAEPRLQHFQADTAELSVRGKNGKVIKLPLKDKSTEYGVSFTFDASKAPKEIAEFAFQCQLIYAYDWNIEKLGTLEKLLSAKKPLKAGLYTFGITGSKRRTDASGTNGIELEFLFESALERKMEHSHIVRVATNDAYFGNRDWESEMKDEDKKTDKKKLPIKVFYGPIPDSFKPGELEFWMRAPRKVMKQKIQHTYKLK